MKNNKSLHVTDCEIIKIFTSNPQFPYLVSFPRTGSHWLRLIMELYFEKPALVRIFYYHDAKDFTCLHTHDLKLDVMRKNVLYLYRNPVDTIYSQLIYHKKYINDESSIRYWSDLYSKHLSKWLFEENFTTKKTILTYENLRKDIHEEFKKVCNHFGCEFDKTKLDTVSQRVSKEELKKKTRHDKNVIILSQAYQNTREEFRKRHGDFLMEYICTQNNRLNSLFL